MTTDPTGSTLDPTDGSGGDSLEAALVQFISRARWFGGKGRPFSVTDVRVVVLRDGEPRVSIGLISLSFEDGGTDLYQAPVASYTAPQDRLGHAFIAVVEGRYLYDALHDRAATKVWQQAFQDSADGVATIVDPALEFHRAGTHELLTVLPLHAVQRRAEQLLGRLRRGLTDEGLPPDHSPGSTRTSRSTRR